jgi:sugar O-acyltransferase (sialic acid O-acetyltransferase NeuD family)
MNTQLMYTKNKNVVIFGLNDLAELAHFYLTTDSEYNVVGFTVNESYKNIDTFKSLPVVSFENILTEYPPNEFYLFIPITGVKMNEVRKNLYLLGKKMGYNFISYISSKCTNLSESIGENCFILEDNTLQPFTKIGNNVILWSGNHIGHHSVIEDHVFFTSHVVLSGHCKVKEKSWIGVNSTIRDGVTIGESTLIGMGSLITKSTEDYGFYIGSPAKKQINKSIEIL